VTAGDVPLADRSEESVVLLAIAGDDLAFEELVLRRQAWLRTVLRRFCGDPALADDLSQEAFVKAWRGLANLHDHRAFAAWLRQIAVRVWIDWSRAQRLDLDSADPDLLPSSATTGGVNTADHRLDLQSALASLRPGPRLCAVLFYGEGMTHSEIAAATGMSIGVVKSHIARSTQRLRAWLREWATYE
jgi:RNA polymerase sigma-70 factor (ECF subfamily)